MNTIVLSAILFLFLLRVKLSFNDMGVTFETTNTLKALACVFVVIHHSSKLLSDDNFLINIYKIHVGYIAVAIFFYLSGYGLVKSYQNKKCNFNSFIRRRLSKVYLPFLIVNLISVLFAIYILSINVDFFLFVEYVIGLKLLDPVLWYINVALVFYLFFYLSSHFKIKSFWVFTFILAFVIFMHYLDFPEYTYISSLAFFFGVFFAEYSGLKTKYAMLFLCVLGTCISRFLFKMDALVLLMNTSLVIVSLDLFLYKYSLSLNKISWLALISYEIYLVHMKVFTYIPLLNALYWLLSLTLIVLLAFFLHKINIAVYRLVDQK